MLKMCMHKNRLPSQTRDIPDLMAVNNSRNINKFPPNHPSAPTLRERERELLVYPLLSTQGRSLGGFVELNSKTPIKREPD